ncbi:MAG: LacI family transcriptional regulator [Pleurocapsa minor GSE-CHR-MK-17-07R]|nr:LacI family transcriptional regulator [Pleurocapsa minor GSE-CHR-MK 17-07R]
MQTSRKKISQITILDVARESGVSYSTVSRVLNGFDFVKGSTREKVLKTAERMGYVANIQARSLAGGKTQIIGLLVPGLDNGYITEIVSGIDQELAHSDYDMMLYTTHRYQGKESLYVKTIANGLADGLILLVPHNAQNYLQALPRQDFPYVLVDQIDNMYNSTTVDATNWQGAYDATAYLIKLGHQRIGFIMGAPQLNSARERFDGYRAALQHHRIAYDESLVIEGDYMTKSGYSGAKRLLSLEQPPTAIFASNDLTAFGVLDAIHETGLRIPEDISVVGFDDIPLASLAYPKLTTVRQPLVQIGQVAVRLLLEKLENPEREARRVTLATELIVRDSSAPRG